MSRSARIGLWLSFLSLLAPGARGQEKAAIDRGVAYLSARAGHASTGESALVALALHKAGRPGNDPALLAALNRVKRAFNGSVYANELRGGADIYEAAVCILAFANIDPKGAQGEIAAAAKHLIAKQKSNGAWDYDHRNQNTGDTSISQYAVLGLWEAENAGYPVPPRVWDRAAGWFLSVQHSQGSWNYHRDEAKPETISMTAAGVGSLLICDRQLARHRRGNDAGVNPLLKPMEAEDRPSAYTASTSRARINAAARKGIAWIGSNFKLDGPIVGESPFYGLYGIERLGALAGREDLRGVNWFDAGRAFLMAQQGADGGWNAQYGPNPNTVWAILFLTKSTEQSIRKYEVKRLGAGTLLGGRELPSDLSTFSIAQGRAVIRPMNGAIDAMLDVLADPRTQEADAALAGLIERYHAEGPKALRPHKDRFRKLLSDRDPGVRRAAAWALGRTADLDVVPALIGALRDPDDAASNEAKIGLQVISRKIDGYGPDGEKPSPEQKEAAAKRWRAWYDSVRPPDLAGPNAEFQAAARPSP